jgi:pilus assembly protein Flp/PilA
MSKIAHKYLGSVRGERGATAVEYGLMVALIVLVIFASVYQMGPRLSAMFNEVASSL